MSDITYALRLLRRSHVFTITVVLTVAIGISATTTIFSVVNAVLLRPLPFADPDRLVQIAERNDKAHLPAFTASALNYLFVEGADADLGAARRRQVRHVHADGTRRS
jgi:hypothetical protein